MHVYQSAIQQHAPRYSLAGHKGTALRHVPLSDTGSAPHCSFLLHPALMPPKINGRKDAAARRWAEARSEGRVNWAEPGLQDSASDMDWQDDGEPAQVGAPSAAALRRDYAVHALSRREPAAPSADVCVNLLCVARGIVQE